jgi:hypothetical protein
MRIHLALARLIGLLPLLCAVFLLADGPNTPIDRRSLVTRHDPALREFDVLNPLTVGNGDFAFTADATGLQTFADLFTNTTPLGTLSQWGWHTFPNPDGWSIDNFKFKEFDAFGRKVPYADVPGNRQTPEIRWLRENPHRLHLGKIGFVLARSDGTAARTNDLSDIQQRLDLWNGALISEFKFEGEPVRVRTVCDSERDILAVHVESALLKNGRVKIQLAFPYGTGAVPAADWDHPDAHQTEMRMNGPNQASFIRKLDTTTYDVLARWSKGAKLLQSGKHTFILSGSADSSGLEFVCEFTPTASDKPLPGFGQVLVSTAAHWNHFWSTGGAIDLSQSKDPRWHELERRIVLSQYLTAIQSSGKYPPQETGLTCNSWEGKFHLEMHWWHEAHFALWDRLPLLENSLGYYQSILPRAQGTAKRQGYSGARWPKMTNPSGEESPSPVGPFLIWQEPHPIFYAELCYRTHQDRATIEKYKDIVMQTAEFMASYPIWQEDQKRFVLGPVLQCSQEIFPKDHTLNPTFELTYWRWALEIAQQWRTRLGMPRDERWDHVLHNLAVPATEDGKYLFAETATGTYADGKWVKDHPSVTAALGVLPGPGIDPDTMKRTLEWVWKNWNWPDTWGWDYPMLAMSAARLGEPERAIDALFLDSPKNHWGLNGHVYQRPGLSIYLPANGGLLYGTAMMAAGWDGGPNRHAPGFPDNGQWTVRYEGLRKAP